MSQQTSGEGTSQLNEDGTVDRTVLSVESSNFRSPRSSASSVAGFDFGFGGVLEDGSELREADGESHDNGEEGSLPKNPLVVSLSALGND